MNILHFTLLLRIKWFNIVENEVKKHPLLKKNCFCKVTKQTFSSKSIRGSKNGPDICSYKSRFGHKTKPGINLKSTKLRKTCYCNFTINMAFYQILELQIFLKKKFT